MVFLPKMLAIFIGSFILAVGIDFFLVPFHLLDGGIIGIGLIINYLTGLKAGLMMMVCSIPIFIIAWFHYRDYFFNSLHGMFISSFMIDLLYPWQYYFLHYVKLTPLVSSIFGGILVGLGIGIMLRWNTSTGGTDLLAQFLSDIFVINVGIMIFIIDAVVIGLGGLLLSADSFILSAVAITAVACTTSICTMRKQLC